MGLFFSPEEKARERELAAERVAKAKKAQEERARAREEEELRKKQEARDAFLKQQEVIAQRMREKSGADDEKYREQLRVMAMNFEVATDDEINVANRKDLMEGYMSFASALTPGAASTQLIQRYQVALGRTMVRQNEQIMRQNARIIELLEGISEKMG